jgi:hypothetical protein
MGSGVRRRRCGSWRGLRGPAKSTRGPIKKIPQNQLRPSIPIVLSPGSQVVRRTSCAPSETPRSRGRPGPYWPRDYGDVRGPATHAKHSRGRSTRPFPTILALNPRGANWRKWRTSLSTVHERADRPVGQFRHSVHLPSTPPARLQRELSNQQRLSRVLV